METCNVLLIGHGNMGRALLAGWRDAGLIGLAIVIDPHHSDPVIPDQPRSGADPGPGPGSGKPGMTNNVLFITGATGIPPDFTPDMIILAVKPQVMATTLPAYQHYAGKSAFLSIAAGKTIAFFERQLGEQTAIIRAMPNLPATVRRGVSVCAANASASEQQKQTATDLLQAVGTVHWAAEEKLDAVTALSGSGPAYVFYLAELLAQAGAELGLNPDLAHALARETIAGAGELLRQSPETSATLQQQVTSPGGTTEAALRILMKNDAVLSIVRAALTAAANRAAELAD